MPRTNVGGEILVALRDALLSARMYSLIAASPYSALLTAATTKGGTTLTVDGVTNLSDLDPVIVRSTTGDELLDVNEGGAPASPLTLLRPVYLVHPIGAQVNDMVARALGHISTAGIQLTGSVPRTSISAATSSVPLTSFLGAGDFGGTMSLMGFNIANQQLATGTPEDEIGSGTPTAPYQGQIIGSQVGTAGYQVLRIHGVRDDSQIVEVDLHNWRAEVTGLPTYNKGGDNVVPVSWKFDSAMMRHWAP